MFVAYCINLNLNNKGKKWFNVEQTQKKKKRGKLPFRHKNLL